MYGTQALYKLVNNDNITAIISCENKRYTRDMFEPITYCRPHCVIHRNMKMTKAESKGVWRIETR